jgi:uncharacterized membrane protein YdjX (TVP38/TMEM64 family)
MRIPERTISPKTGWDYAKPVVEILLFIVILVCGKIIGGPYLDTDVLKPFIISLGGFAPLVFAALSAILVLIPVPMILSIAVGGWVFGPLWGACYSLVGITAGACVAFFVGRYLLANVSIKLNNGRLKRTFDRTHRVIEAHGLLAFIGLRLVFFANFVLNYAAGGTAVRFRDYSIGTFLGLAPKLLVFSYLCMDLDQLTWSWNTLLDMNLLLVPILPLSRLSGMVMLAQLARVSARESKVSQKKVLVSAEGQALNCLPASVRDLYS